jgi:hypothetical protein
MCNDYETNLIKFIKNETNISEDYINEVISCYKICTEEDINEEPMSYYHNIHLLTGFDFELIKKIFKTMSSYEEEIL